MTAPWTTDGSWLRCALHAHTNRSDGELAPRHLARHYARAGYDVLAITDHWRITDDDSVDRLLVIPSVELNCILPGARDGHVLGYGVSADEAELHELAQEHADLQVTSDWIEAHGGIAFLAHPYWTGVTPGLELPDNVVGMEVYNAGCELETGRGLVRRPLGRAARERQALSGNRGRRLPLPGVRLGPRVDVGQGRRTIAGGRSGRSRGGLLLLLDGAAHPRRRSRG